MMCNAYECPFRNEMGYCKVTACVRRDLAEKYNSFYTTDHTTIVFPTYTKDAIEQLAKERDEWMEYAKQDRKRSIERYHELAVELDRVKKERDYERETADDWQHRYFELARRCSQLKKERDAAIADLKNGKENNND